MLERFGIERLYDEGAGPTVVVGLSGGVDSSVSAAILKWQGFRVVGLFMRNWEEKDGEGHCTTEADYADVKAVANHLDIPYYSINFADKYMDNVFAQFLRSLEQGFTPNPDILCNREIKFGHFAEYAQTLGEFLATGHYARVERGKLLKGADEGKDQSYFLCGVNSGQLKNVLFPVGGLQKSQVREIAELFELPVAKKKDSTGICFIGERKFREFLTTYLGTKEGDIKTLDGKVVGRHVGLMHYTIGQKKGLGIGGRADAKEGESWVVVRKELGENVLIVNNGECEELLSQELVAVDFNWIAGSAPSKKFRATAKIRYRQADQPCTVEVGKDVRVLFEQKQRAVTPGQWVVLYDGDVCLGGGVIRG